MKKIILLTTAMLCCSVLSMGQGFGPSMQDIETAFTKRVDAKMGYGGGDLALVQSKRDEISSSTSSVVIQKEEIKDITISLKRDYSRFATFVNNIKNSPRSTEELNAFLDIIISESLKYKNGTVRIYLGKADGITTSYFYFETAAYNNEKNSWIYEIKGCDIFEMQGYLKGNAQASQNAEVTRMKRFSLEKLYGQNDFIEFMDTIMNDHNLIYYCDFFEEIRNKAYKLFDTQAVVEIAVTNESGREKTAFKIKTFTEDGHLTHTDDFSIPGVNILEAASLR
ncbi:hypothetical protein Dip510_001022 [Elusimicrobium posterum]|uniref:hypothetical protein n=1 Tax=Elusimicrobium posterum TaxID=3116653 RepID=UPI003C75C0CF